MPLVNTANLTPSSSLTADENQQVYCGLDSCVTVEVLEEIKKTYPREENLIYDFEKALQGPYLEIMLRGFAVNDLARRKAGESLRLQMASAQEMINEFAMAVWDAPLNPRSPKQLQEFFYSRMKIPEIWISQKGERKLSLNREVLEKLHDQYLYAKPFVNLILGFREMAKQLDVFETEIDADGRFRSSYNIAGTETGRPSSSSNAFGTGGNAQNIAAPLRYVFEADPGYKLCVIDLEQVEARDVGFFCGCLFDRWTFLDNCESGDLHTANARLIWPELPWTGQIKQDKEIASGPFYRDFSFRDMAKRGSHLSNYYGTAWTAARSLKVPLPVMEEFQARYIRGDARKGIEPAYPEIALWWEWTAQQLQTTHQLLTPFGRRRHFFGRPNDDTTLREAIAFLPQSTTADRMNLGLLRIWRAMPQVQLLAQTYDSVTFQYHQSENEDAIISQALDLLRIELVAPNGRKYVVPGEAKVGWNWGNYTTQDDIDKAIKLGKKIPRLNLEGLRKWKSGLKEERIRRTGLNRMAG
jgi:DNA polymerase I-like protein with 3'-5' exonuclease and polymerase domains